MSVKPPAFQVAVIMYLIAIDAVHVVFRYIAG
jgi:hypothetical protein